MPSKKEIFLLNKVILYCFLFSAVFFISDISYGEDLILKPRIETNFRPGTERSIGMVELWIPIAQDMNRGMVVYTDIRFMDDNSDNNEFNAGVGYRKIVRGLPHLGDGIAGVHGWIDKRSTKNDNTFIQTTLGAEWKGDNLDILANSYISLSDGKKRIEENTNTNNAGFAGTQILVNTDQTIKEEPLAGIDLELGYKLPIFKENTDVIRAYAGAYHFWGDDADSVSGGRVRFQADITSDISIGARYQKDNVRGSQSFLDLTFRFPWGNKKKYKEHGLYARLDESPERDIDIVSNDAIIDNGLNKPIVSVESGETITVFHVNNTAAVGGDGSIEKPFNTLTNAQAAATGEHDIIYVHRGDGTSTGQNAGIVLSAKGQMLAGSGTALTFDSSRFKTSNGKTISSLTLAKAGTAPVITNTGGDGVTVTDDNVQIQGIIIDGATDDGVDISDVGTITIQNVTIQNSGVNGIKSDSTNVGGTYTITNNTISNNAEDGIESEIKGASVITYNLNNNIMDTNEFNAVYIKTSDTSSLTYSASDNTITNTNAADGAALDGGRGMWVFVQDDSSATVAIANNTFTDNRGDAIEVEGRNATDVTISGSITDNTFTNAINTATHGANNNHVEVEALTNATIGSSTDRFIISGNTFTKSTEDSLKIWGNDGTIYAEVYDNVATQGDDGLEARVEDAGYVDVIIRNNTTSGFTEAGIQLDGINLTTGTIIGQIYDNTSYDNGRGMQINVNGDGNVGTSADPVIVRNNTIYSNLGQGIYTKAEGGAGELHVNAYENDVLDSQTYGIFSNSTDSNIMSITINNNDILRSGSQGIRLGGETDSTGTFNITNNTINIADGHGVYISGKNDADIVLDVSGNTVQNITGDGVELSADDDATIVGSISSNTIMSNDEMGIRIGARGTDGVDGDAFAGQVGTLASAFTISDNVVTNNTQEGVNLYTADDEPVGYISLSGNTITGNGLQGIEIDEYDSQVGVNNLTIDFGGGDFSSIGNNSIYNNAGVNLDYNPDQATVLKAENNWWGQDADPSTFDEVGDADGQNEFIATNGASIDADPRLSH